MSSSVSSREQYDQLWAGAWGDMQRFGPVHRHQREHLLRLIRKLNVRTILDVGCGAGDNLASIAQMMPHLTLSGADVSAEALALAAKRASGLTLYQLDVQREALKDRFDLVMSIQVI